jgi:hypothetical protein
MMVFKVYQRVYPAKAFSLVVLSKTRALAAIPPKALRL